MMSNFLRLMAKITNYYQYKRTYNMCNDQDLLNKSNFCANLKTFYAATDDELAKKLKLCEHLSYDDGNLNSNCHESLFASFHPKAVRMVVQQDDYYLNCRANHFVLIFGSSEELNDDDACVVCLANHKGDIHINVYTFID
jgi:hypothetical protein